MPITKLGIWQGDGGGGGVEAKGSQLGSHVTATESRPCGSP